MTNEKPIEPEIKNMQNEDAIDIIKKLTDFISYLKIGEDCQMLLKPSEIE